MDNPEWKINFEKSNLLEELTNTPGELIEPQFPIGKFGICHACESTACPKSPVCQNHQERNDA